MVTLVVVEALALGVLAVLVCGLLRSHAEILHGLDGLGPGSSRRASLPREARAEPVSVGGFRPPTGPARAVDLAGTTPTGEPVRLAVAGTHADTLLAFLSSACTTCSGFWRSLSDPQAARVPGDARLVIVTKSPGDESGPRIRQLAPDGVAVIMSTEAWTDYAVPVTPYFVLIDAATGSVVGQGSGRTWDQVTSLLRQSSADGHARRRARLSPSRNGGAGE